MAGARLRDVRNGFSIPPALTAKTVLDAAMHPTWWVNLLTTEPLTFASLSTWAGTVADLLDKLFDPTMTIADLEWIRAFWDGPLIIKGIQTVEDARRVVDAGADAIVLSNHGGRQLDRAPVPLRLLPDVARGRGRPHAEVRVDTGIMSGADVVAAIALGAERGAGRPRLPLRPDGRRRARRRPGRRDPQRPRSAARWPCSASRTDRGPRSAARPPSVGSPPWPTPTSSPSTSTARRSTTPASCRPRCVTPCTMWSPPGHHVIIATGRSIVATTDILAELGIETGYAVCSNGAVTLELDALEDNGFRIIEAVTFDPAPALNLLRQEWPDAVVAVEELGGRVQAERALPRRRAPG